MLISKMFYNLVKKCYQEKFKLKNEIMVPSQIFLFVIGFLYLTFQGYLGTEYSHFLNQHINSFFLTSNMLYLNIKFCTSQKGHFLIIRHKANVTNKPLNAQKHPFSKIFLEFVCQSKNICRVAIF